MKVYLPGVESGVLTLALSPAGRVWVTPFALGTYYKMELKEEGPSLDKSVSLWGVSSLL